MVFWVSLLYTISISNNYHGVTKYHGILSFIIMHIKMLPSMHIKNHLKHKGGSLLQVKIWYENRL